MGCVWARRNIIILSRWVRKQMPQGGGRRIWKKITILLKQLCSGTEVTQVPPNTASLTTVLPQQTTWFSPKESTLPTSLPDTALSILLDTLWKLYNCSQLKKITSAWKSLVILYSLLSRLGVCSMHSPLTLSPWVSFVPMSRFKFIRNTLKMTASQRRKLACDVAASY